MINIGNVKYDYSGETYYIGRPSILSNPYPTKKSKFSDKIYSSDESLRLYKRWLWNKIQSKDTLILKTLKNLASKDITILCWCVDKQGKGNCHGFIIRDAVDYLIKINGFNELT